MAKKKKKKSKPAKAPTPEKKSPIQKAALRKSKKKEVTKQVKAKPQAGLKPAFPKKPPSKGLAADAMEALRAKLKPTPKIPKTVFRGGVERVGGHKGGRRGSPMHQTNIDNNLVVEAGIDAIERLPRNKKQVAAYEQAVKEGTLQGQAAKDAAARLIDRLSEKETRIKIGMDRGTTMPAGRNIKHTRQSDPRIFEQRMVKGVQQAFDTEGRQMVPLKGPKRVHFTTTNQARKFAATELPKALATASALKASVARIAAGIPLAMLALSLPEIGGGMAHASQVFGKGLGTAAARAKLKAETFPTDRLKKRAVARNLKTGPTLGGR